MAIAAVMAADLFNGLNTHVWTGWIFFAVFLGIVLVWAYTVSVELYSTKGLCVLMLPAGYLFYHFSRMVRHTYLRQRPLSLHFCLLLLLYPPGRRPRITSAVHRQGLPVLVLS